MNEAEDLQNPSAKLALITMYQSMLKHDAGIEWLKSEHAWIQAINYCFQDETIYVVRCVTASKFIYKITFRDFMSITSMFSI